MKKILLTFVIGALFLTSCGKEKKEEIKKEAAPKVEAVKEVKSDAPAANDQVAMGEKLFTEKTCVSCHQLDAKLVGPAIKEIAKVYEEKSGDIVNFLKGNHEAIVDTNAGQVAIMKANLDGFVKDLSEDQLQALAAYIKSAK